MDIRELRIEDRVSHNGDIGKVVWIIILYLNNALIFSYLL